MNTNPNATTILCYGDSNTFGQRSDDVHKGRWPADVRWTGQLQNKLGNNFRIIEEGLSSRTTDLEYTKAGRNGKTYLTPCLQSHNPIDTVILMLGTNDAKTMYGRTATDIAHALEGLIDDIEALAHTSDSKKPRIILVSPILINDLAPNFAQLYAKNYDHNSALVSERFAGVIELLATKRGCTFIDAAQVAEPGDDGIHLSRDSHQKLAEKLAAILAA